ncbi:hypothetical protein XENOCAPTIV_021062 [Xenoophorus captivus]|uniref:Uncharacterized protein n=1 Tax=Xenoophorus captivus TaxID=1517983 RepID=A0ABV0SC29_9TELE
MDAFSGCLRNPLPLPSASQGSEEWERKNGSVLVCRRSSDAQLIYPMTAGSCRPRISTCRHVCPRPARSLSGEITATEQLPVHSSFPCKQAQPMSHRLLR